MQKNPSPEFWEKQCAKWLPPSCTWVQRRSFTTGASARLLVIYLHFFSFVWLRHNKDVQSPYGLKQWRASHSVWLSRTISEEALTNKFLMGWFFFPEHPCALSQAHPLSHSITPLRFSLLLVLACLKFSCLQLSQSTLGASLLKSSLIPLWETRTNLLWSGPGKSSLARLILQHPLPRP